MTINVNILTNQVEVDFEHRGYTHTLLLEDYAAQQDKMVWVCDELGLSIDHAIVEQVDLALWDMLEEKQS